MENLAGESSKLVDAIIDGALQEGWLVSVNDGAEIVRHLSDDRRAIRRAIAETAVKGRSSLSIMERVSHNMFESVGFVRVEHVNGVDLLEYSSDNLRTKTLVEAALVASGALVVRRPDGGAI